MTEGKGRRAGAHYLPYDLSGVGDGTITSAYSVTDYQNTMALSCKPSLDEVGQARHESLKLLVFLAGCG